MFVCTNYVQMKFTVQDSRVSGLQLDILIVLADCIRSLFTNQKTNKQTKKAPLELLNKIRNKIYKSDFHSLETQHKEYSSK